MAAPRSYWVVCVLLNGERQSKVQTYLRNRNATQYMGVFMLSTVRIDLDHGTTMFVGGLLVLNLIRIDLDHGTTMFVGGLLVLNLVRIDLDHGTTMFVGGLLVLNLDRIEREVCVCAHVRVYTFSMCVHILNSVHVLNLDLVRILLLFPCKK
jgi:hypothetical protein